MACPREAVGEVGRQGVGKGIEGGTEVVCVLAEARTSPTTTIQGKQHHVAVWGRKVWGRGLGG